jgi:hypothetical protein
MVELVRVGRSPEELAKELEPCARSIRVWVRQADIDQGRRDGLSGQVSALPEAAVPLLSYPKSLPRFGTLRPDIAVV